MVTYTLKIVDIRNETEDTVTVCFKQPALRKVKYKAGQYLTLIFRINGRRYIRPYSFSSAPSVDKLIEVTIKRIPNGIVSNHIHDQIKTGDSVEVFEPMGEFIYHPNEDVRNVYFWGVGSGITPLMSLIKEILALNSEIQVNLVYGNRNFGTTIFNHVINELLVKYKDQFKVWHFHTQAVLSEDNTHVIEGRIKEDRALDILTKIYAPESLHYICGPSGLKESVKTVLNNIGVPLENVFVEDFELVKDPKDFEDIHTQVINLKFENVDYTLEVIKGKSILESALDAGIELAYSCQTGNCSTCKGICIKGELKMIGLSNERSDLMINEYLLCCSHPLTMDVCIEI
ncbi:ferredoxin--NADP reductase [Pedobacter sp. PLR]|uniref:ferredoxin--NADP reductase n=1 Tax=Pedobacter sp. PLR TaxID=2994465 RepID=UPI002246650A|nr:ferredoxin--NADP reductase [Pedobacter sp. PLR]MCX2453380.1 ferredoxin--NADP reductase [Pedobacter sp. PLR]